jgi:hypothetical protein
LIGATVLTVDGVSRLHSTTAIVVIYRQPQLGAAVARILGARGTALAMFAASMATQILPSGLDGLALHGLMVLAVLTPAVLWRWPAPRPRIVLLAAKAQVIPLWILLAICSRHSIAGVLTRHRRRPTAGTIAPPIKRRKRYRLWTWQVSHC